jgi:hypothetical protein
MVTNARMNSAKICLLSPDLNSLTVVFKSIRSHVPPLIFFDTRFNFFPIYGDFGDLSEKKKSYGGRIDLNTTVF